jgi:hypothetical protein
VAKTLRRTLLALPRITRSAPPAGRGLRGLSWRWPGLHWGSSTPFDLRCDSTHDSRPISGQRERAWMAASEPAAVYDRIRPVDTASDEAVSPQTSLLRPAQPPPAPWIQA